MAANPRTEGPGHLDFKVLLDDRYLTVVDVISYQLLELLYREEEASKREPQVYHGRTAEHSLEPLATSLGVDPASGGFRWSVVKVLELLHEFAYVDLDDRRAEQPSYHLTKAGRAKAHHLIELSRALETKAELVLVRRLGQRRGRPVPQAERRVLFEAFSNAIRAVIRSARENGNLDRRVPTGIRLSANVTRHCIEGALAEETDLSSGNRALLTEELIYAFDTTMLNREDGFDTWISLAHRTVQAELLLQGRDLVTLEPFVALARELAGARLLLDTPTLRTLQLYRASGQWALVESLFRDLSRLGATCFIHPSTQVEFRRVGDLTTRRLTDCLERTDAVAMDLRFCDLAGLFDGEVGVDVAYRRIRDLELRADDVMRALSNIGVVALEPETVDSYPEIAYHYSAILPEFEARRPWSEEANRHDAEVAAYALAASSSQGSGVFDRTIIVTSEFASVINAACRAQLERHDLTALAIHHDAAVRLLFSVDASHMAAGALASTPSGVAALALGEERVFGDSVRVVADPPALEALTSDWGPSISGSPARNARVAAHVGTAYSKGEFADDGRHESIRALRGEEQQYRETYDREQEREQARRLIPAEPDGDHAVIDESRSPEAGHSEPSHGEPVRDTSRRRTRAGWLTGGVLALTLLGSISVAWPSGRPYVAVLIGSTVIVGGIAYRFDEARFARRGIMSSLGAMAAGNAYAVSVGWNSRLGDGEVSIGEAGASAWYNLACLGFAVVFLALHVYEHHSRSS